MDWHSLEENNAKCKFLSKHPEKVECFNDAYALSYQRKNFWKQTFNRHILTLAKL